MSANAVTAAEKMLSTYRVLLPFRKRQTSAALRPVFFFCLSVLFIRVPFSSQIRHIVPQIAGLCNYLPV